MPRYQIVPATQEHVMAMLPNVRQADRDEVLAASGLPMDQVLGKCVSLSEMAWTGLVDDQVACLFGVRGLSMLSMVGVPWLIGTDLIEAHAKPFLRRNRKMVGVMLDRYPHLANHVDARNATAIEWLQWLGFTILPAEPFGPYRMPFHKFEISMREKLEPITVKGMTKIRPAELHDIERLVDLGEILHRESPRWSRLRFSRERAAATLQLLIEQPTGLVLVAERDNILIGGIAAYAMPHWASDDIVAQEVTFFIRPDARGGLPAYRLITAMREWAREQNAVFIQAGTSTGLDPTRTVGLYERAGFTQCIIGLEVFYHGN